jgi:hypothetical protein
LQIRFLDDQRDAQKAIANMRQVLADPNTLAMVGMSSPTRAKAVFDTLAGEIQNASVPFLSDIALNSVFAAQPSVFTTRASQDDERMPVLVQFVREMKFSRPAFIGIKEAVFSSALGDALASQLGPGGLVADHRLTLQDNKLDPHEVAAMVADLKDKKPDFLFTAIGGNRSGPIVKQLMAAGVVPPLFVAGRIESLSAEVTDHYPASMYQLAWDGLPDAYNDRLRTLIARSAPAEWVFEGRKIDEAPGWKSGECKPRSADAIPNPLDPSNLRAISVGTQHGDMVRLIATVAKTADPNADVHQLRAHILNKLRTAYATGRGTFQGGFENWSFRPESRAAARTPLIVERPTGLGGLQLAPFQFIRLRDNSLKRIDTLYLDIDLIRAVRIDDSERTFFAEFYLSIHDSNDASIDRIEFTNAFLDPRTNDRQLTVRTLHKGGRSATYPDSTQIYYVSGKFLYEPQLANYPFDLQRFAINIQPKLSGTPFVIQPPPQTLRDSSVTADGWDPRQQYVGYDEDFVPTIDAKTHEQSVVPFYKASFVWLMKRQATDYYLRVVVPLAFILIIAYLSIFIPQSHFEAIVTIQVTALLSAVALYLALPKVDADTATLSDRIFVFTYMAFSLMIGLSVLRVNRFVVGRRWIKALLGFAHILLIPLLVIGMSVYVYRASLAG